MKQKLKIFFKDSSNRKAIILASIANIFFVILIYYLNRTNVINSIITIIACSFSTITIWLVSYLYLKIISFYENKLPLDKWVEVELNLENPENIAVGLTLLDMMQRTDASLLAKRNNKNEISVYLFREDGTKTEVFKTTNIFYFYKKLNFKN